MHLHNEELGKRLAKSEGHVGAAETDVKHVTKFGFQVNTCCGFLPMNNEWKDDWIVSWKVDIWICLIHIYFLYCQ